MNEFTNIAFFAEASAFFADGVSVSNNLEKRPFHCYRHPIHHYSDDINKKNEGKNL